MLFCLLFLACRPEKANNIIYRGFVKFTKYPFYFNFRKQVHHVFT